MKKIIILSCTFLAFLACKQEPKNEWESQKFRQEYLQSCVSTALQQKELKGQDYAKIEQYCRCVLDKMSNNYASPQQLEQATEQEIAKIAFPCAKEMLTP